MLSVLISILIALLIFGLLYWVISLIPLPPPLRQVAQVIFAVIMCIWLIYTLLPLAGHPYPLR